jgi:G3E family GTPase
MSRNSVEQPVRFVLLGGFLGSGKTTALLRLARHYSGLGKRVGIITNDQAEGLVDTGAFVHAGFTTEEIPAGCFCCHFEKLLEASGRLVDRLAPDIILAEPVGSCTDLVNAVIAPLKKVYADRFTVAPYAVLADPERVLSCLGDHGGPSALSRKVTYLYSMQQNEADIIALNKSDTLSPPILETALALLHRNFPRARCIPVSARTGAGFEALLAYLEDGTESGLHPAEVDYSRYTEGEIALGWLNARIRLAAEVPWDGNGLLARLAAEVRRGLASDAAEIAHFKMRMRDGGGNEAAVHSTSGRHEGEIIQRFDSPIAAGDLIINLRAESDPGLLKASVLAALEVTAGALGIACEIVQCTAFAPSPPVPPPPSRLVARYS